MGNLKINKAIASVLLLSILAILLVSERPLSVAYAQSGDDIKIIESKATGIDPKKIVFQITVDSQSSIKEIKLNYIVESPETNVGGTQNIDAQGKSGYQVFSTDLSTNDSSRYIPIGVTLTYSWTIESNTGTLLTTEKQTYVFLDGRFDWKKKESDNIEVFYYGDDQRGVTGIGATKDALESVTDLLQVTVPYKVKVVIWDTEKNGEAAQRSRGSTFDAAVSTLGTRVATDLVHIYETRGGYADTTRHEIAHIVTHVAGDGAIGKMPAWLDEGTAVYAQKTTSGREFALKQAIRQNNLFRPKTEGVGAPNTSETVDAFYGQSHAMVVFIINTWGEQAFSELFSVIKSGSTPDGAFQAVFGIDLDDFYNQYREYEGLEPIEFQKSEIQAAPKTAVTQVPYTIATGTKITSDSKSNKENSLIPVSSSSPDSMDSGNRNNRSALIVGSITVVITVMFGFISFRLVKR